MKTIFEFLKGKRTYLIAVAGAVYAAFIGLGIVPSYDFIWGLLGSGAFAFLRAGVKLPEEQTMNNHESAIPNQTQK